MKLQNLAAVMAVCIANFGVFVSLSRANVTLPSILSNHAVLQRSDHTAIWGKAAPAEKVKVSLGDATSETVAGVDGQWKTTLDLSKIGEGPFELVIEGANRVVVSDVIVGEVWLCSGQSNMAYSLNRSTGGMEEIAHSANTRLRQFTVSYNPIAEPQESCKGAWVVADPTTSANFSAVSYYFAKDLQKARNTPVGIVRSAWAGTEIMCWISATSLATDDELNKMNETAKKRVVDYPKLKESFVTDIAEWEKKNDRADRAFDPAPFASPGVDESGWQKVALHNTRFKTVSLPDAGVVWLRKTVMLPAAPAGQSPSLSLIIGAFDQTFVNGKKVGQMTEATSPGPSALRFYKIPADTFKEGENVIAIRIFTPTEGASFGSGYVDVGTSRIQLGESWLAKPEYELPALTDKQYPQLPGAPGISPAALYNGMINPITPNTFAGVVWYQGEQDSGRKEDQYLKMLTTLITDWRARFNAQLPFCICQLPNNGKKTANVNGSTWPNIREAQRRALELPATSLVTTIDVGEEDVHPPDKRPVGDRIAAAILGSVYREKVITAGPLFDSMKIEDGKAIISFKPSNSALVAKPLPADYLPTYSAKEKQLLVRNSPGSELEGFAIRDEKNQWHWAAAKITGAAVIVSSPDIANPTGVRYAWQDNPTCNLYNDAGLPASPFQAMK